MVGVDPPRAGPLGRVRTYERMGGVLAPSVGIDVGTIGSAARQAAIQLAVRRAHGGRALRHGCAGKLAAMRLRASMVTASPHSFPISRPKGSRIDPVVPDDTGHGQLGRIAMNMIDRTASVQHAPRGAWPIVVATCNPYTTAQQMTSEWRRAPAKRGVCAVVVRRMFIWT